MGRACSKPFPAIQVISAISKNSVMIMNIADTGYLLDTVFFRIFLFWLLLVSIQLNHFQTYSMTHWVMRWSAMRLKRVLMLFHRLHSLKMLNNPSQLFQPFLPSPKMDLVPTNSPLQLLYLTLTRRSHLPVLNQPVAVGIMTTCPGKGQSTPSPPLSPT